MTSSWKSLPSPNVLILAALLFPSPPSFAQQDHFSADSSLPQHNKSPADSPLSQQDNFSAPPAIGHQDQFSKQPACSKQDKRRPLAICALLVGTSVCTPYLLWTLNQKGAAASTNPTGGQNSFSAPIEAPKFSTKQMPSNPPLYPNGSGTPFHENNPQNEETEQGDDRGDNPQECDEEGLTQGSGNGLEEDHSFDNNTGEEDMPFGNPNGEDNSFGIPTREGQGSGAFEI